MHILQNPIFPKRSGFVQPLANILLTTLSLTFVLREPVIHPKPRAAIPQQPEYRNLNETTLASAFVQPPLNVTPFTAKPPAKVAQQPQCLANLTTGTFYVPDVNIAREAIYNPRPKVPWVTQPEIREPLTLIPTPPVVGNPVTPAPFQRPPAKPPAVQPDYRENLQTTVNFVPDQNLAREPYYVPKAQSQPRQQPVYQNSPPSQSDLYFLNDVGFGVQFAPRIIQPQLVNNLIVLTAVAPTLPPKSQDLTFRFEKSLRIQDTVFTNPVPIDIFYFLNDTALSVPQVPQPKHFDFINGTIQLLTFSPPELPENFYDWQLPKRQWSPPQDTNQGQNPDFIPPTILIPTSEITGGWEHRLYYDFHSLREQARRKREEREERESEVKRIASPIDKEIAALLLEQETKAAEKADLARIQGLADAYAGTRQEIPRNIAATLLKAQEERSRNALEQLARELENLFAEEEMVLMLLLLSDD